MPHLTKDDCNSVRFTQDVALEANPDLAALAMRIIAVWSAIEMIRLAILTAVIKSDTETAASIMTTVGAQNVRANILSAILKLKMPADHDLIERSMRSTRESESVRNSLAHWLWGTSKALPGYLIVGNPRQFDALSKGSVGPPVVTEDSKSALKFNKADLEHELERAKRAQGVMMLVRSLALFFGAPRASHHNPDPVDTIRARLRADPEIGP